ncbi:MAG: PIN domain nuclease [Gammaproteobacteria bacterium]
MILPDTSVCIDYFNGIASVQTDLLDTALADDTVALGDVIYLEILQGFRTDKDYNAARKVLKLLPLYDLLGADMVETCARNYRSLRKKGITVRQTTDVVIASVCIEHKLPLLYADRNFSPFEKHLGLIRASNDA